MRTWPHGLVALVVAGALLSGCGRQSPPAAAPIAAEPVVDQPGAVPPPAEPSAAPPTAAPAGVPTEAVATPFEAPAVAAPDLGSQEKYDAALLDALNLLADRKYADALAALEAARAVQETDQIKLEIDKVKKLMEQQAAAERTVQDVQAVLADGDAAEAARLAAGALQQYGDGDTADQLARLKREADALVAAQITDNSGRRDRFRKDGEDALKDNNFRAAAIAFEQALQYGDDADLRRKLDDLRGTLSRYDDNCRKAAELRRDPVSLEDAVATLQEAQKAWDTPQVRQDIDSCTLALQKRRDRLSVADFEVRGEVGLPDAGRTVGDELLPAFKGRFDLVERGQLGKVIDELHLQAGDLADNDDGRREVGRLAKVRFLVLGSISRVSGVTVNARLVDVHTGLVVQTAKVVAPTLDDLLPLLPQLANVLMMTDEQKIAYEHQLAQQAQAAVQPVAPGDLPAPPDAPAADQPPPPPVIVNTPRPPDLGGIKVEDFDRLPPPPPPDQPPPETVVVVERERPVRDRLLQVSVEIGDNLFRRGCYREAHRHFEFAMSLSPEREELQLRIDRCRPYLPPPPPPPPPEVVVVINAPPPPPPRPRLAVLNFAEFGDPDMIPPGSGAWTADNLAPYFCPPFEVVDRGEVFWYMGRLGMSMRDLMTDPSARRWLGRALGVRYFLLGTLHSHERTVGVATHLLDAEYGYETGGGRIEVGSPWELRLRMAELARLTLMRPEERQRWQHDLDGSRDMFVQAQVSFDKGDFSVSLGFFEKLLQSRPDDVRVQVMVERCRRQSRQAELEAARRREWERQQALLAELQRRQWELARAAEAARLRVQQEAAVLTDDERMHRERQREEAHAQLMVQAQAALRVQNFQLSISFYESALALKPSDDGYRELAQAQARAQEAARARAAKAEARRQAELLKQRDAELAQLRARVEDERRRREADEETRRKVRDEHDQAEYTRLLDQAQRLQAQAKYDAAVASLQSARQLHRTDEVERLLSQALVEQARATAQSQDAQARAALERRLATEKARREQAEAEARRNGELYTAALTVAQQALAEKRYDDAVTKYNEAGKLYRTDVVLTGLRRAEEGRVAEQARAEADKRKHAEEQSRAAEVLLKLTAGQKALEGKQYDRAIALFTEVNGLAPGNVDALAGLSKARQARDADAAQARRASEDQERQAHFRTLLAGGKANLTARQYDAAVVALTEATQLNPADPEAKAALAEAQKARGTATAESQKKAEAYQKWMGEGRVALAARQYDTAINAFREAQKVLPGDQTAAAFLKDAEKGRQEAAAAVAVEAHKRQDEQQHAADARKSVAKGRAALAAHDLDGAAKALAAASQLAPADPEVQRAQQELQKAQDAARTAAAHQHQDAFYALVKKGRDALLAKRYDEAVKALTEATHMQPDDRATQDLLRQAEQARAAAALADHKAEEEAHKAAEESARKQRDAEQRRDQVRRLLADGRSALAAKQYDAAGKAFADASKLAPQDPAVAKALQDLDQARAAAAAEAKRQAQYQDLMKSGRAALAAKRYDDAVKAFTDAGRVLPGDREAASLLQEATRGRDEARAAQEAEARKREEEQRRRAEFTRLLQQGQSAMAAKRYDDAVKAYGDALKLEPGDAEAAKALREATAARDAAKAPLRPQPPPRGETQPPRPEPPKPGQPMPPPPQPDPVAGQVKRLMDEASAAMAAKRYDDAIKAYGEALKLSPGNAAITKALHEAEAARTPPAQAPKPPVSPPATNAALEYTNQMWAAAGLERQQKYAEAVAAYKEALRLMPGDAKAMVGLEYAQFGLHMAAGRSAQAAKHFADAVREYEEALKFQPGNADATAALKWAREGKP